MVFRIRMMWMLVIAVASFCGVSYLQYAQSGKQAYSSPQDVAADFPISVVNESGPALIDWQTYTRESEKYRGHLIANAAPGWFVLNDGRRFAMHLQGQGRIELEVRGGLKLMNALYAVEMGNVRPIQLRALDHKNFSIAALIALGLSAGFAFFTRSKNKAVAS